MTVCRLLLVFLALPWLAACGGTWPDLAPDPGQTASEPQAPSEPQDEDGAEAPSGEAAQEAPPPAAAADQETLSRAIAAIRSRLVQERMILDGLVRRVEERMTEILPETPMGEEAWATAQMRLSRLSVLREDFTRLFRAGEGDAARVLRLTAAVERRASGDVSQSQAKLIDKLDALGRDIAGFLNRVEAAHTRFKMDLARLQAELAESRPAEVGAAEDAESARPTGDPVMTIAADAVPARYRDAVATLVDRAEAARASPVYQVVAAGDAAAQEKGRAVLSLLSAFGVAPERSEAAVDLSADSGTVRVFVE